MIFVVVTLVVALTGIWYWNQLICWTDAHPGLASWVQAIGSIGTIIIAAWAVNRAHELQRVQKDIEEFDELTRTLEVVFQLVGGAAQTAEKILKLELEPVPATPEELAIATIELDAFADALSKLDLSRLGRYDFIEAALVANMTLRRLKEGVIHVQSKTFARALEPRYLKDLASAAHSDLADRARKLAKITANRGGIKINDVRPG